MSSSTRPRIFFLALLASLWLPALVLAAPVSWLNPVSGNWNDGTKWSGGNPPGPGDDAIVTVLGTYTVTVDVNPSVLSLTLGGASGVQTLSSTSHTFTLGDTSSIGTNGSVLLVTSTITGSTLTNSGVIELRNGGSIASDLDNDGTINAKGGGNTVTGSFTSQPNSVLRVDPTTLNQQTDLTVPGFINHGQIIITSTAGLGRTVRLTTTGTLTNASDGQIVSQVGTGAGTHTLEAMLNNQGTLTADYPLNIAKADADHQNSGAIAVNAPNGGLTVTQTGTTPSFTHTGTIAVATGRTMLVTGGAFSFNPGTSSGLGTLAFDDVDVTGLTLTGTSAPTDLRNGASVDVVDSGGTINAKGAGNAITGSLVMQPNSVLRVDPTTLNQHTDLTVPGFINHGQIIITSTAGLGRTVRLTTTGTLVNASDGTIASQVGTGAGTHTLEAEINNQGALTADYPLNVAKASADHQNSGAIAVNAPSGGLTVTQTGTTPSFTHTGTIAVATGRTMLVTGGAFSFNPGTSSGLGTLAFDDVDVTGLTLTGTSAPTDLRNGASVDVVDSGGTINAKGAGNAITGSLVMQPNSVLRVDPTPLNQQTDLTVPGFINHGQIIITSTAGLGRTVRLTTTGTLVNASDGTIASQVGTGAGTHTLEAEINNQGALTADYPLNVAKASADHQNSGAIAVNAPSGGLTVTQTGTTPSFTHTGTIAVATGRTMLVTGGAFSFNPGTSSGLGTLAFDDVDVTGLTLTGTSAPTDLRNGASVDVVDSGGTINAKGAGNAITGGLVMQPNSVLRVDPTPLNQHTDLTVPGFTNHGQIIITSTAGLGRTVRLTTTGTLTNASDGEILSSVGTGAGTHTLEAEINNEGALTADYPLNVAKASADHQNSGAIAVNAPSGGLTVTQTGTTPSFTHTGTIAVATGRTMLVTGGAFSFNPGTSSGLGTLAFDDVDVTGLTLTGTSAPTDLRNGASVDVVDSGGTINAKGAGNAITGSLVMQPNSVLRVDPTTLNQHTDLTVPGFTNHGQIIITSTAGLGRTVRLTTTGTLTNASDGEILSSVGTGAGTHTLEAMLNNQGTVTSNHPLNIAKADADHQNSGAIAVNAPSGGLTVTQTGTTPSFTHTGTIAVATGRTMLVTGGAFSFNPGTSSGLGTLAFDDVDVTGLTLTGTSAPTDLRNGASVDVVDSGGTINAKGAGNAITGSLVMQPNSVLRVDPTTLNQHTDLTVPGFINHGQIIITSTAGLGRTVRLTTTGTLVNASDGTIASQVGTGAGTHTLEAEINNQGALTADYPLNVAKASADHQNSGAIAVNAPSGGLTVTQTGTTPSFTHTGTIAVATGRTMLVTGGAFSFNPGTSSGLGTLAFDDVDVTGLTLTGTSAPTDLRNGASVDVVDSGGTINAKGAGNAITGGLVMQPNSVLRVDPTPLNQQTDLTVPGFINHGQIIITSTAGLGRTVRLTTTGTLVNASDGTIASQVGTGAGTHTLEAEINNQGALTADYPLNVAKASADHQNSGAIAVNAPSGGLTVTQTGTTPSFTHTGTIAVATGRTMLVTGGAFSFNPGTSSGLGTLAFDDVDVTGLTLTGTSAPTDLRNGASVDVVDSGGTINAKGAGNAITGGLVMQPNSVLRVDPTPLNQQTDLTVPGFINHGQIIITSTAGLGRTVRLTTTGLLTNANDGLISSHVGTGAGTHTLEAELDNYGVMEILHLLTLADGPVTNRSGGLIRGFSTLNVSGVVFHDDGITAPGTSPGVLTITGNDPRTITSALQIQIGGLGAGTQYDRLVVNGTAHLDGTLDLSLINGFVPVLGDSFAILTTTVRDSTFRVVSGRDIPGGLAFQVKYKPNRVDLIAGVPPPNNPPVAGADSDTTDEDTPADIDLLTNDSDPDMDPINVVSGNFSNPPHGSVNLNPDQTAHYSPDPNFFGADSFTYEIVDDRGGPATGIVRVTVSPRNDPPAFVNPTPNEGLNITVVVDSPLSFTVSAGDPDPSDLVTLTAASLPAGATMTPPLPVQGDPASSLFQWTPNAGQLGIHPVQFDAEDDSAATASRSFTIEVIDTPLACGEPHWVDEVPAGFDYPQSEADVGIDLLTDGNLDGEEDMSLRLQGPVSIQRSAALDQSGFFPGIGAADAHLDVIDTEIISMSLTDAGFTLTVGAGLGQGGVLSASRGVVHEDSVNAELASSFFDVFFEIDTPGGRVYNQTPLHVEGMIDCVPPISSYLHPEGIVPLYTSPVPGEGMHVANLVRARHNVGPQPACPAPHFVDSAPAGIDSPDSEADVGIDLPTDGNLDGEVDQSFRFQGPVSVRRTAAMDVSQSFPDTGAVDGHLDVIDTEIISMSLAADSFTLTAGAGRGAGGALVPSLGAIHELAADPSHAWSFLDVFFEVGTPDGPVYNHVPLRIAAVIDCIPPVASYLHTLEVIPLYTSPVPGEGMHVANLVTAQHRVGGADPEFVCQISGPAFACVTSDTVFTVATNIPNAAIQWGITGDAIIVGPTNGDSVTVRGTATGAATLAVTASAGDTLTTCELDIEVHGCATPVVLSLFQVEATNEGVELRWRFAEANELRLVEIERSEDRNGPWTAVPVERRDTTAESVALDRMAVSGTSYFYRLHTFLRDGTEMTFGPLPVTAALPVTKFGLEAVIPNPTSGSARVEFTVGREAVVRLSILDVQGREVARLADGWFRPGRYQVLWDGEVSSGRAAAGIYFVRYQAEGQSWVQRIARLD